MSYVREAVRQIDAYANDNYHPGSRADPDPQISTADSARASACRAPSTVRPRSGTGRGSPPLLRSATADTRMRERRGGLAADDRRGLVDEFVVLKGRHHEEGKSTRRVMLLCEDGVAYMPAPHRQALALTFFKVASAHDRPPGVAGKNPPARFHLVVDFHDAGQPPEPAGELLRSVLRVREYTSLPITRDVPATGKDEARVRARMVEYRLGRSDE